MKQEVKIERHVRRQEQIEKVVGIERQRVRIASERLPAAVVKVPVRNLAAAKDLRGDELDRIVRREIVAEEEKAENGEQRDRNRDEETDDNAFCLQPAPWNAGFSRQPRRLQPAPARRLKSAVTAG
jgi:hypothetical protein